MPISYVERLGRSTNNTLAAFGDFWRFAGRTFLWLPAGLRWKNLRLLFPQMYEVGVQSVPVVAITAFAMKGDEERIREGGCEAYLSKPISVSKFIETVRNFAGT